MSRIREYQQKLTRNEARLEKFRFWHAAGRLQALTARFVKDVDQLNSDIDAFKKMANARPMEIPPLSTVMEDLRKIGAVILSSDCVGAGQVWKEEMTDATDSVTEALSAVTALRDKLEEKRRAIEIKAARFADLRDMQQASLRERLSELWRSPYAKPLLSQGDIDTLKLRTRENPSEVVITYYARKVDKSRARCHLVEHVIKGQVLLPSTLVVLPAEVPGTSGILLLELLLPEIFEDEYTNLPDFFAAALRQDYFACQLPRQEILNCMLNMGARDDPWRDYILSLCDLDNGLLFFTDDQRQITTHFTSTNLTEMRHAEEQLSLAYFMTALRLIPTTTNTDTKRTADGPESQAKRTAV